MGALVIRKEDEDKNIDTTHLEPVPPACSEPSQCGRNLFPSVLCESPLPIFTSER